MKTKVGMMLAVLVLAGCNPAAPYLELSGEQHAAWEATTEILVSIKDAASMEEAKDSLAQHMAKCQSVVRRVRALPRPSSEILMQLEDQRDKLERAANRLQREVARVRELPGGAELLKDVAEIVKGSR